MASNIHSKYDMLDGKLSASKAKANMSELYFLAMVYYFICYMTQMYMPVTIY